MIDRPEISGEEVGARRREIVEEALRSNQLLRAMEKKKGVDYSPFEAVGCLILLAMWYSVYQVEGQVEGFVRFCVYAFYGVTGLSLPFYFMGFFFNMWAGADRQSDEPPYTKAGARKGLLAMTIGTSAIFGFPFLWAAISH